MKVSPAWPVIFISVVLRCQDAGSVPHKAELDKERQQADVLFAAGKLVDALPLYSNLAKREPTVALFAERKAAGLIAKSATLEKTSQQMSLQRQAYAELLRARGLGDNSPYVVTLLGKFNQLFESKNGAAAESLNLEELMKQGQGALAHGDYKGALASYTSAFQADPESYDAAIAAAEAEVRLNDVGGAGEWYRKAIAIDPDREAAHLAWGNVLLGANQLIPARDRFLGAVIAWPYSKDSWDGLKRWAAVAHTRLASPTLNRPIISDHFDPKSVSEDGTGRGAWLQYAVGRIAFKNSLFRAKFPGETQYRHTLLEEAFCLQKAADAAKSANIPPGKLEPSLATLIDLNDHKMLEPWVLLHGADSGIVKDYAAYREAHRELLRAYILQYDIHPVKEYGTVSSSK